MNNLPKNDNEKEEILIRLGKELHYLMSKDLKDWDKYDNSNWNNCIRCTVFEKPRRKP